MVPKFLQYILAYGRESLMTEVELCLIDSWLAKSIKIGHMVFDCYLIHMK